MVNERKKMNTYDFPGKGKVAVLRTKPASVLEDYARLLDLIDYQSSIQSIYPTLLKINISWQTWYPACSTTPWQLEGVIQKLFADGYSDLIAAHNKTVVVDAYIGEKNNKHKLITDRYKITNTHLYEPEVSWNVYKPQGEYLVLHKIYPDGVKIPDLFHGKNIIQFPTVKTHVFTTITGAMKNAFGGLLSERRHWTHSVIHETLVDLLMIQREIHPGILAVMDGTFAGDGPGPRAMRWHEKDVILASSDQVAIDAISAKLQGFNPMELKFIRLAHEKGLGIGDPKDIEIVGDEDVMLENWHFIQTDTFASKGQKAIYHGPLKPFEKMLLQSPIVPWSYFASNFYHNVAWYPAVGKKRVESAAKTKWGQLFSRYGEEEGQGGIVYSEIPKKELAIGLLIGTAGLATLGLAAHSFLKKTRKKN